MSKEKIIPTHISAYLEGRMSQQEMQDFEHSVATEPELDQEVKLSLLVRAGLAQEVMGRKREQLKTLLRSTTEENSIHHVETGKVVDMRKPKTSSRNLFYYATLAASILMLAGLVWNFSQKSQTPTELFATHYEVLHAPDQMGSTIAADSLLRLGHAAYNQQAYEEAQRLYRLALSEGLRAAQEPYLYVGIAALETNDFQAARKAFVQAQGQQPERAAWYLALLDIKEDNIKHAKHTLDSISLIQGHFYQEKAKVLLKQLD